MRRGPPDLRVEKRGAIPHGIYDEAGFNALPAAFLELDPERGGHRPAKRTAGYTVVADGRRAIGSQRQEVLERGRVGNGFVDIDELLLQPSLRDCKAQFIRDDDGPDFALRLCRRQISRPGFAAVRVKPAQSIVALLCGRRRVLPDESVEELQSGFDSTQDGDLGKVVLANVPSVVVEMDLTNARRYQWTIGILEHGNLGLHAKTAEERNVVLLKYLLHPRLASG